MDVDQFIDGRVEVVVEFVVGDAIDLPVDAPQPAVADFVLLCLLPAGMPIRVVDLERPLDRWIGSVRVNDLAARKGQLELANELDTPTFEGFEHAQFQTGASRFLPVSWCLDSIRQRQLDLGREVNAGVGLFRGGQMRYVISEGPS